MYEHILVRDGEFDHSVWATFQTEEEANREISSKIDENWETEFSIDSRLHEAHDLQGKDRPEEVCSLAEAVIKDHPESWLAHCVYGGTIFFTDPEKGIETLEHAKNLTTFPYFTALTLKGIAEAYLRIADSIPHLIRKQDWKLWEERIKLFMNCLLV